MGKPIEAITRGEILTTTPTFPGIVLDGPDLAELYLKRKAGVPGGARGLSLSNNRIQYDDSLEPLISQLNTAGRVRIKQDLPRRGTFGGGTTGSTVLYFEHDESISSLIGSAPISDFDALFSFYAANRSAVQSVTVTPNMSTSPRDLKGVEILFNQQADKWWQIAARMPWSFERGVIVVTLPIEINHFLNVSDYISEQIFKIARLAYPKGVLQRINLAISQDDHVVLELAAGLSHSESDAVRKMVTTTNRGGEVQSEMTRLQIAMRERRIEMARTFAQMVGIGSGEMELLGQSSYTYLDMQSSTIGSGVVRTDSDPNTCNPMNNGTGGILLVDQHTVSKIPAGLPLYDKGGYQGRPPENVEILRSVTKKKKIGMTNLNDMARKFMENIQPVFQAEVLSSPFHKDYREKKEIEE